MLILMFAIILIQVRLQEKVTEFGHVKMKTEVNKFINMTQEIAQKCQVKYIPQSKLPKDQQLYGQDIFGYEIWL